MNWLLYIRWPLGPRNALALFKVFYGHLIPQTSFSVFGQSLLYSTTVNLLHVPTMLNSHYWFSFFKQKFQEKAFTVSKLWMRSSKDNPCEWEFPGASEKVKLCNSLGLGLFPSPKLVCSLQGLLGGWVAQLPCCEAVGFQSYHRAWKKGIRIGQVIILKSSLSLLGLSHFSLFFGLLQAFGLSSEFWKCWFKIFFARVLIVFMGSRWRFLVCHSILGWNFEVSFLFF